MANKKDGKKSGNKRRRFMNEIEDLDTIILKIGNKPHPDKDKIGWEKGERKHNYNMREVLNEREIKNIYKQREESYIIEGLRNKFGREVKIEYLTNKAYK